jgi:3'5'-cyclic nucleotide phosphodiesterase
MDPSFTDLRAAIYTTREEYHHFRQVVVNAVVSTDLFDNELNEARQRRWDLAFPPSSDAREEAAPESSKIGQKDLEDRQATVVMEYMVQASDVAHTMQHWHVYRKWVRLVVRLPESNMPRLSLTSVDHPSVLLMQRRMNGRCCRCKEPLCLLA